MIKNLLSKIFPKKPAPPQVAPAVLSNNSPTPFVLIDYTDKLIKEFEQCRLEAYQDGAGVWTIGWGETLNVYPGMVITQSQADSMYDKRILGFIVGVKECLRAVKQYADLNEMSALVSFAYNVGLGRDDERGTTGLKALLKGRTRDQISEALLLYNKSGGKPVRGLKIRRAVEKELYDRPLMAPGIWDVKEARARYERLIK